jgi:hypothetical protein
MYPLGRHFIFREDRFHWTLWNTGIAIYACFWVDDEHIVIEMKSLNRTDQRAVSVTAVYAWFCNDVRHLGFGLLRPKMRWGETCNSADLQSLSRQRFTSYPNYIKHEWDTFER